MKWAPYSVTPELIGESAGLYDEDSEGGDDVAPYPLNPGERVECLVYGRWQPATVIYTDPFCVGVRLDDGTETEVLFTEVRTPERADK